MCRLFYEIPPLLRFNSEVVVSTNGSTVHRVPLEVEYRWPKVASVSHLKFSPTLTTESTVSAVHTPLYSRYSLYSLYSHCTQAVLTVLTVLTLLTVLTVLTLYSSCTHTVLKLYSHTVLTWYMNQCERHYYTTTHCI